MPKRKQSESQLDNLKPITSKAQARELQKKSAKKRSENIAKAKTFKDALLMLLDETDKNGVSKRDQMNAAIFKKAIMGDVRAFEVIRDTVGEKIADKLEATVTTYEDKLKETSGDDEF